MLNNIQTTYTSRVATLVDDPYGIACPTGQLRIRIAGQERLALIDPGSMINLVPQSTFKELGLPVTTDGVHIL